MTQADFVKPAMWMGGKAAEYAVEVLKNGGLGTTTEKLNEAGDQSWKLVTVSRGMYCMVRPKIV